MPTNYVDNVPLQNVTVDVPSGVEHGRLEPNFNPTSGNQTGLAFATLETQLRNTDSGKTGVACMVCHSAVDTRDTPFHNSAASTTGPGYVPALGTQPRSELVAAADQDILEVPDQKAANLGYSVGGGSFRLSPHAIGVADRAGPLTLKPHAGASDGYLSGVFKKTPAPYEQMDTSKHQGFREVLSTRAEFCSGCHDVTNPLTIKNSVGKWVGGFPIERTYAEWSTSRYADRPGNRNFDPAFKRDCQTCHMQQDYGQPGTAHTLYQGGAPIPALAGAVATDGATLALHASEDPTPRKDDPHQVPAGRCRPGLSVPNLDEFHKRMLEKNVPCIQEPKDIFGARVAQYQDPDGLTFSVGERAEG
jgi:hypothetical protein